jgi:hypothetical protein
VLFCPSLPPSLPPSTPLSLYSLPPPNSPSFPLRSFSLYRYLRIHLNRICFDLLPAPFRLCLYLSPCLRPCLSLSPFLARSPALLHAVRATAAAARRPQLSSGAAAPPTAGMGGARRAQVADRGDPATVAGVVRRLGHPDWLVREAAVDALQQVSGRGDPLALEGLLQCLHDPDWRVRQVHPPAAAHAAVPCWAEGTGPPMSREGTQGRGGRPEGGAVGDAGKNRPRDFECRRRGVREGERRYWWWGEGEGGGEGALLDADPRRSLLGYL